MNHTNETTTAESPARTDMGIVHWVPSISVVATMMALLVMSFARHHVRTRRKRKLAVEYAERDLNQKRPRITISACQSATDEERKLFYMHLQRPMTTCETTNEMTENPHRGTGVIKTRDPGLSRPNQHYNPRSSAPHRNPAPRSEEGSPGKLRGHPIFSSFNERKQNSRNSNSSDPHPPRSQQFDHSYGNGFDDEYYSRSAPVMPDYDDPNFQFRDSNPDLFDEEYGMDEMVANPSRRHSKGAKSEPKKKRRSKGIQLNKFQLKM